MGEYNKVHFGGVKLDFKFSESPAAAMQGISGYCQASSKPTCQMHKKILIMGLPGAGKTTLANMLGPVLEAVIFNADTVRANEHCDLGFSIEDRIEHARRMGLMCDRVVQSGSIAIADFICPTPETRTAFGPAFTVWVDRINEGRFADTNRLFVPPTSPDVHVTAEGSPGEWADRIARLICTDPDARDDKQ